jgi:hypothetical protein
MEIDIRVRSLQQPVLVPVRLSNPQHIPMRLQCRHVVRFQRGVGHDQENIDDRL